jgi:membrane protease YdiL (CAAX protease family)
MNAAAASESIPLVEPSQPAGETGAAVSPPARKPRVWTAFAAFLVAMLVGQVASIAGFVVAGVGIGIFLGAQGMDAASIQSRVQAILQQPLPALLLSLMPFQLGMTAVVLLAAWRSKEPLKQRLGLVPQTGRAFGGLSLATMAAFTVSTALATVIGTSLLLGPPPMNTPMAAALADGSWWTITLLSILLSVVPALVEEILFRGYIQRRFLQRWSPAVAIGVSSLLFAVMHMDSLQHIIAVVPLAVVTGLLAYRTNSVKPGMLVHGLHNVGAVGFGALATLLTPHFSQESLGLLMIGAIAVLGLIGLPAVVSLLRGAKPQPAALAHIAPLPAVELADSRFASDAV